MMDDLQELRDRLKKDESHVRHLSDVVMKALLGRLIELRQGSDPPVVPIAGCSILFTLGRFLGEFGRHELSAEELWEAWQNPVMKELFCEGVAAVRNQRN